MKLAINPSLGEIMNWERQWIRWLRQRDMYRGEGAHWDWFGKALRIGPGAQTMLLALTDDDGMRAHGLMLVRWPKASRLAPGRTAAYVEYLEIAPWNRSDCSVVREHKGIGTLLMAYAVTVSEDESMEGRVNLCSLPQAEPFYKRLGMIECGVGDGPDHELKFFELEAMTSAEFLIRATI